MTSSLAVWPIGLRVTNPNGQPVPGAQLLFYVAGTTSPLTVYADVVGTVPLGTVVYTDAAGYPVTSSGSSSKTQIYTTATSYRLRITDSNGVDVVPAMDNIQGAAVQAVVSSGSGVWEVPSDQKTATYNVLASDMGTSIDCDPTGATFSVNLVDATTVPKGSTLTIKHFGTANQINIVPHGSQVIDDAVYVSLIKQYDSISLRSTGANWRSLALYRGGLMGGGITAALLDSRVVGGLFQLGDLKLVPTSTVPPGWMECNGQTLSRTQYPALFVALGSGAIWGTGDGVTTFNLPTVNGYFLRFWSHGSGRDPDAGARTAVQTGGATGDNVGSYQASAVGPHDHTVVIPAGNNIVTQSGINFASSSIGGTVETLTTSNPVAGTGVSSETRAANVNLMLVVLVNPAAAGGAASFPNAVQHGIGAPNSLTPAIDGDFYIDTNAHALYGPRTGGAWGTATSLIGPPGTSQPLAPISKTPITLANGLNSNIAISSYNCSLRASGPTAPYSIGGFSGGGSDGQLVRFFNTTANPLTIVNADAGSSVANRILTLTGANVTLRSGLSFCTFEYDASLSSYILVETN